MVSSMDEMMFDRQLEDHLCFQLYRASKGMGKLYSQALKPFRLTFSQYLVLLALWDKDGVSISDIGGRTGMGIGTLNPILKRLASQEWIQREPHESDKRTMLIYLAPKASETKQAINQAILKKLKNVQFEDMDVPALMKQLSLLQEQLGRLNLQDDDS